MNRRSDQCSILHGANVSNVNITVINKFDSSNAKRSKLSSSVWSDDSDFTSPDEELHAKPINRVKALEDHNSDIE